MSLYEKLAQIEDKISGIEVKLGLPQRRHLLVRKYSYNTPLKVQVTIDTLILPRPYINPVPPRYANLQVSIEGSDSIYLSLDDVEVEIPRTKPKTLFIPDGDDRVEFIIDPPVNNFNQIIYSNPAIKALAGTSNYKLIYLSEKEPTTWKLILRKETDNR
ncbi:hypothetical protein [Nostoc sp. ChiQUE01b]|uniref:hypothetical protein n=1 Tax=Nostoc sp. ChiQUE01b TaxID=3075376 RepID=UPI002AD1F2C4|nr:hypothetical protein [Nostoc sp. ChiQUE01b]MDZ8259455.1 hypothetical protein [Nostoc sp. ChiQUE01b]